MADLYVASTGSNTAPYETWAKAATALLTATAAAGANDTIYAHQETEVIIADTTYVLASGVKIICSNDTGNAPPLMLGTRVIDGSATAGVDVLLVTPKNFIYGLHLKTGGAATAGGIDINASADGTIVCESCIFEITNTNTSSDIVIGRSNVSSENLVITRSCSFIWGATNQGFNILSPWQSYGDSFAGATAPTVLFGGLDNPAVIHIEGGDLSTITGTLFAVGSGCWIAELINSKLGVGVTVLGATNNQPEADITIRDCNSGDVHYSFAHYNYLGSTVVSTAIYANAAPQATYDGTNGLSWVIASTANSTYHRPYVSPWIDLYHDGTSAITPSIEILRDGSATAYQDDEVWGEFSYQGTSGSTRATIVNDRKGLLATAANQATGALGAADWTGEGGTAWFGKLTPTATITPAEIGHLRGRVIVGEPSTTVYVDPQLRTT